MIKQSKGLTVFLAVTVACLILSASIAVPVLCRPFYYAHIEAFQLEEYLGLEEKEIRRAYDEMFGHFEQMGMDQESIDRMKAQAEQELQKQAQAQQDDGTMNADEESKWTLNDDEDTLD